MAQLNCFLIYNCKMTWLHTWVKIANNWPIKTTLMIMYNKQIASTTSKYYSRYNITFIYSIVTTYLHYSVTTFSCTKHYRHGHDLGISSVFFNKNVSLCMKICFNIGIHLSSSIMIMYYTLLYTVGTKLHTNQKCLIWSRIWKVLKFQKKLCIPEA